ncbi:hypothetical protein PHACT_10095 [Pseudohongiella acticola]|uniref:Nudix hydrolase domain-containing protein n=2 Tax=Pseudohongiella acticola TaxID=1524254 RepID=A0A1E8CNL3_9GAMM|nr:hypothetical protein PHACT_10095 [Pseudohongiella acticola]
MTEFSGCKLALILNGKLLVYKRDFSDSIPFSGMYDLPGGGREGEESPVECVLRELEEEFGLQVSEERLSYCEKYALSSGSYGYFYAAKICEEELNMISFGNEGVSWQMMSIHDYLSKTDSIPHLKERIHKYLERAL